MFQQYSLYPHLTVYDNLAFPLRSPARRMDEQLVRRRIQQVAELLHIEHKLGNRATALSGGEMQRVAIGRALVREPAVYLMDEPLSSLDAKLRAELRLELKRIQRELGTTILYVTHDQIEAMTMADRIGVMNEGVLVQLGTPRDIYERPDNAYVASRLGMPAINLIPAELMADDTVPPNARTVGLRTEHIKISPPDRPGPVAEVHWVEHLGDQNHVHLKLAAHSLVTLADPAQDLRAGDRVSLEFDRATVFRSGRQPGGCQRMAEARMMIDREARKLLFETVAHRVIASADELTDLDRAIGDGDHGANMRRGFEAVLAAVDDLSAKNLGESLKGVGTTLVMKVGGASGPLYGTLFLTLGKSLADEVTHEQIGDAFAAAIEAVKARGKSDVGQKTMLDVLFPVLGVLREGGAGLPVRLKATAREAAEKTIPMRAIRGRASFLGERSIGHMDPGARSSELIVDAVADVMEGIA